MSEEIQKKLVEEVYKKEEKKSQIAVIVEQLQKIENVMNMYTTVRESLMHFKNLENKPILFHLGGEIYVSGKIVDDEKALINVGANVYLEYDIPKCIEILDKRINDFTSNRKQLLEIQQKIQTELIQIENSIVAFYQQLKK